MGADQRDVDAAGDQRFERRIGRGLGKAVEPAVLQVWDARRKLKAEQSEEREDVIGIATAVGVMAANRDLALVIQEAVEDMQSLARCRCDHLGVERGEAVGEEAGGECLGFRRHAASFMSRSVSTARSSEAAAGPP